MDQKLIPNRDMKEMTEAAEIASFYGFKPLLSPTVLKQDFDAVKNFSNQEGLVEKAALTRIYFEDKMMGLPQPTMFYCERPFPGSREALHHHRSSLKIESSLISIGSSKAACECLTIEAAISILNKFGFKDLEIRLNSIGDKESMSEFQKKLSLFIRKNIANFPSDLRQAAKKDIFAILKEPKEEWKKWQTECPKPIDSLSEPSRLHFKEVLEFLEIMEIPYVIDHFLVGNLEIGSETIFAISQDQEILAHGFRFNRLTKKIGYKKDIPATTLNLNFKTKKKIKILKAKNKKLNFYLVQFGTEAKLKSFLVLRELYKAGVNVGHSIAKDKLSSQIGIAETSEADYIILIGQKEALENSVILRHNTTRAQELININDLASRVKNLV